MLGSGVLEIALGAMMLHPRTRRLGGRASVALLAAVFPANVQMAMDVVRDEKAADAGSRPGHRSTAAAGSHDSHRSEGRPRLTTAVGAPANR